MMHFIFILLFKFFSMTWLVAVVFIVMCLNIFSIIVHVYIVKDRKYIKTVCKNFFRLILIML